MKLHSISGVFHYCKWCGKSLEVLSESDKMDCEGDAGVTHIGYLKAKKMFYDNLGFIVDETGKIISERKM